MAPSSVKKNCYFYASISAVTTTVIDVLMSHSARLMLSDTDELRIWKKRNSKAENDNENHHNGRKYGKYGGAVIIGMHTPSPFHSATNYAIKNGLMPFLGLALTLEVFERTAVLLW